MGKRIVCSHFIWVTKWNELPVREWCHRKYSIKQIGPDGTKIAVVEWEFTIIKKEQLIDRQSNYCKQWKNSHSSAGQQKKLKIWFLSENDNEFQKRMTIIFTTRPNLFVRQGVIFNSKTMTNIKCEQQTNSENFELQKPTKTGIDFYKKVKKRSRRNWIKTKRSHAWIDYRW